MFQQVLVPLDGSASAERAVGVAARLARATGGVVTLLRVIHPYWEPDAAIPGDDTDAMEAADYLAEVREREALADVACFAAISVGAVIPAILEAAREYHADLIVLCQHRHNPLMRWAHPRTAAHTAAGASVPVLVLHEHDDVLASVEAARISVCG